MIWCLVVAAAGVSRAQTPTDAVLDTIQHNAFLYFWNQASSTSGLIRDRAPASGYATSSVSTASTGFGISAICIGIDHGWVSRANGRARVLQILQSLRNAPQGSGTTGTAGNFGLFYHFLDFNNSTRAQTSELSTVDTGLLLAGIIDAKQFFDSTDATESSIRALADSLYYRMDWNAMCNGRSGIAMQWTPESGFSPYQWTGYCEAMIMYILAFGSPTHPAPSSGWQQWTSGYSWQTQYGYSYVIFPPLFGHQYSHCWIDFRGIRDAYMKGKGIDYFENSRRATLAQRAYAIANPGRFAGYSDSLWGMTASDVPSGYSAHGAPPAQNDDGTIVPTAPISSIPFAPEAVIPVIRNMWENYRSQLWTRYGFRDAFNPSKNWLGPDIIGIDQGPEIIMIENYRTGKVWKRFMKDPDVQRGLQAAGFQPTTAVREQKGALPPAFQLEQNWPNPFNPATTIGYSVAGTGDQGSGTRNVKLIIYNLLGQEVAVLVNEPQTAGRHVVSFSAPQLPSGTYFYTLSAGPSTATKVMTLLK